MPIVCEFYQAMTKLNFPRLFVDRPRLAHGLRLIDIGKLSNIRISSRLQHITKSSAECQVTTYNTTPSVYHDEATVHVFALAPGDLEFLTGEYMHSLWMNPDDPGAVRIDF